jgi:hypothetical protein
MTDWVAYHTQRVEQLAHQLKIFDQTPNQRGGSLHQQKMREYERAVESLEECRYYAQHAKNSEKWIRQGGLAKYIEDS